MRLALTLIVLVLTVGNFAACPEKNSCQFKSRFGGSAWSLWSICSKTCCEVEVRTRHRVFKHQPPQQWVDKCKEFISQTEECRNERYCIGTTLGPWSECSSCGKGSRLGDRIFETNPPDVFKEQCKTFTQKEEVCLDPCLTVLPPIDDNSVNVNLNFSFPYYGTIYNQIWIYADAALLFGDVTNAFNWLGGSIYDDFVHVVAPYIVLMITNSDDIVDLHSSPGDVNARIYYYYVTNLTDQTIEVRSHFPLHPTFEATWSITVKWEVRDFASKDLTNLFDVVLVTDELNSFVKLVYRRTSFSSFDAGLFAGDGSTNYQIQTTPHPTLGSNVGEPGVFWYRVDGLTVELPTS